MLKVKVRWAGFTGSPGWSNFYFDDVAGGFPTDEQSVAAAEKVRVYFNAIKQYFPAALNWQIQSDVDHVHSTSGEMYGVDSIPPIASIAGTAVAGPHSGASGVVTTWRTAGVRNGRRVRGRTFLVPCSNTAYGNDGTLDTTAQGIFQNAATALAADDAANFELGVWSRNTGPGIEDGEWFRVTGATVPDRVAILRSRRD